MHCTSNKQAQNYFVLTSVGESHIGDPALSVNQALATAGILNASMSMHQFIPADCEEVEAPSTQNGESVEIMMGRAHGKIGDELSAGICIAKLQRKGNKKFEGSLVCSHGGKLTEEELKTDLTQLANELLESQYADIYEIANVRFIIHKAKVEKAFGAVISGICFTNFVRNSYPCEKTKTRFLEYRCEYNKAKYCFLPVDAQTAYDSVGAKSAAAAIINMSTKLETYEIETDLQAYKAGFHTFENLSGKLTPDSLVEEVKKRADAVMGDGKVPVLLSGSNVSAIGMYQAGRVHHKEASLLSLDGRINLRESFQGSKFHPYTLGHHGSECFSNVVTVGARVCANREKNIFNPDTTWFSMDMIGDPMWVDDVMEELNDEVVLSINANVFDPSCMNSQDVIPDGLLYREVMPLLKKVARKKTIVGICFHGLLPEIENSKSETSAAHLIYKVISFIEAYSANTSLKAAA